ncbi:MAG TPA: histidine phosphatase family protein [Chloroflexota bacterium]
MDLYLVRHAVAFDPDETRWPDDRDRPLTPDGEKRFRRAAAGLAELIPTVDVVLSSRFVRAWRTAELLCKEAGWPAPVACEALESGRAPAEALQALQAYTSSKSVVLVGHEPGMHELASYLLTADTAHAQLEFRKGGVARLELFEGMRPGAARLRWLLPPSVLRAVDA